MVLRTFGAFDNEAFSVVSAPGGFPPAGSPIINNSSTPVGTIFEYSAGFPVQVITLDDTDDPDFFDDDDEGDHVITDGAGLVANGTEVESESYHFVRQIDAFSNPFGPEIQITVFSQNGQTSNIWGMSTDTPLIDGARYRKVGGSNDGTSEYEDFVCFTAGTRIATARGECLIEDLREGDRVITRDNGMQEVRWAGSRVVNGAHLQRSPHLRPILVKAGSLGNGMPERDTYFSPNHRILLSEPGIALLYGDTEVFAAAKDLLRRPGISKRALSSVTYVHVMFDQHEAILSNGMWSESFLPGTVAMESLGSTQQREIFELFPDLKTQTGQENYMPARRIARSAEAAAAL